MVGCPADDPVIGAARSLSQIAGDAPSMGGFFLLCTNSGQDRTCELNRLKKAFGELGFAPPELIRTETCVIAAYPNFESRSGGVKRYPNGNFAFVCGTCLSERSVGAAASFDGGAEEALMGHYALVFARDGGTRIKLDRFGGYHIFYNRAAGIVSSSFYAICAVLRTLTLSHQSACEYVFNGVVSGDATLFDEVPLAPIGA